MLLLFSELFIFEQNHLKFLISKQILEIRKQILPEN